MKAGSRLSHLHKMRVSTASSIGRTILSSRAHSQRTERYPHRVPVELGRVGGGGMARMQAARTEVMKAKEGRKEEGIGGRRGSIHVRSAIFAIL